MTEEARIPDDDEEEYEMLWGEYVSDREEMARAQQAGEDAAAAREGR